ncbi:MAG: hypothetical protein KJO79_02250, partial [Verrucomicrobiae bacterium]|nr:hypothetical protein [Verrucomicrobiae bacterium]NNJ85975.1 hypothetical protein [Akkermansiaceae bacterium]
MKRTLLPILFGLAITTAAQAGPDPVPSGKEIIPPPPPSCLWTWFAGGSVGQLDDWDEEIYTLHVGVERKCTDASCSHAIFLEVGYTEKDEGLYIARDLANMYDVPYGSATIEAEIIPITINYKLECAITGNLNWYVGAGAGVALVD